MLSKLASAISHQFLTLRSHELSGPLFPFIFPPRMIFRRMSPSGDLEIGDCFLSFPAKFFYHDSWEVRVSFCSHRRFPLFSMMSRDVSCFILEVVPLFVLMILLAPSSLFDTYDLCVRKEREREEERRSACSIVEVEEREFRTGDVGDQTRILRLSSNQLTALRSSRY